MGAEATVVVGIDWAKEEHQACILAPDGTVAAELAVKHSAEAVSAFAKALAERAAGAVDHVLIGIEVPHGALVETLMERGFRVFALNPKQMDRFRDRHFPSGAKDDRRDAYVIADSLRTDRGCFREVRAGDAAWVELRELSRVNDELRVEENRLANRLREQLYRYFPQVLAVSPAGDEAWVLELLERASTPAQARRWSRSRVGALLKKHRIRRVSAEDVHSALRAPSMTLAEGTEKAASAHVRLLIPRIRLVKTQRKTVKREMERVLSELAARAPGTEEDASPEGREHRDVEIIRSMPGVGIVVAATVLAEAHGALSERNYQALRAHAGIAPVTQASGSRRHGGRKRPKVLMRQACNDRLRNAVYHWARVAAQRDAATKEHYARLRSAGHSHGRALRGVADRLFRILLAMLRDGTLYEARQPRSRQAA